MFIRILFRIKANEISGYSDTISIRLKMDKSSPTLEMNTKTRRLTIRVFLVSCFSLCYRIKVCRNLLSDLETTKNVAFLIKRILRSLFEDKGAPY